MLTLPTLLHRGRSLLLAALAALLALPALAQNDPPGRVGRIAWTSGDVYLNNPQTGELGAAPLNQPLTSGDIVSTAPGARAELQIGAMTLRLDSGSRIVLDRIDDESVHVRLDDGGLIAKLPTDDTRRDFLLDTPHARFRARDTGLYRFDQDHRGTVATPYFGTLRADGRDAAIDIGAGEAARVWADDAGRFAYRMMQGRSDEFTQWSAARDQQQRASATARYVSPEMTGAQDLDRWGDWSETPDYGAVWFPRTVAADWAPYRDGHWAWVAPWGWTWVGNEPWGFAPFHYGRWVRIHGAWAWVPGNRVARPAFAPALVVWMGTSGGSFSLSIGTPPVRWFPLAPREVYVPFYRSSRAHVRHVNEPHVRAIRNLDDIVVRPHEVVRHTRFIHRDEPRAVSVAPSRTFRHERPEPRTRDARREEDRSRQVEHRQSAPAVVVRTPRPVVQEVPRQRMEERRPSREPSREKTVAKPMESREANPARVQAQREERRPERQEPREKREKQEQRDDRHERKQRADDERRR